MVMSTFSTHMISSITMVMSTFSTHMISSLTLMQYFHLDKVEEKSHNSSNSHFHSKYFLWINNTTGCFKNEPNCQCKKENNTHHCTNNFSSMPTESEFLRCWSH